MATIFNKIISGDIPCHKILENERFLAFLDIHPIKPGHTLVIPKKEIDYLFDMDDEVLSAIMIFAKKAAKLIKKSVPCRKIGVVVCGLEVPHAHIHLIPIDSVADIDFSLAKPMDEKELKEIAETIRLNAK
ncbi:MAG: HIT family protein [Candidatus Omnitrophica bacterium]|nr:HIT family protein [Candidatus Omnitrophota bacterium]